MPHNEGARWLFKEEFDFDSLPETPDFDIFTKSLLIGLNADGRLAAPERQWVIGFAAAHGAPPEFCDMLRSWAPEGDHQELLESRETGTKSKPGFIYNAIKASSASGEFNETKRAMIHRLARPLGISSETVDQIEGLVRGESELRARRLAILFDNRGKPF
jgi:hypothetical protein